MTPIDPLSMLPYVKPVMLRRGSVIYGPGNEHLHLVDLGIVKVARVLPDGKQLIVDLYGWNDLFGEGSLFGSADEVAIALTDAAVITWHRSEVEDLCHRRPQMTTALMQMLAARRNEFERRVHNLLDEDIKGRLRWALAHFGARIGDKSETGTMLPSMTHEFLSQYIGTSREIVTAHMGALRRNRLIRFSRHYIWLSPEFTTPKEVASCHA